MVAVELDENGAILDGHHRVSIAEELGIDYPTQVRMFANEHEKRNHVLKLNLLRRQLGPLSWAKAFEQLLEERGVATGPGARNDATSATVAEVASELGVAERTAYRRREALHAFEDSPEIFLQVDRGDLTLQEARALVSGGPPIPQRPGLFTSDSAEWNTPSDILDRAVQCLGVIDLDPCSNTGAPNVPATTHYTATDDGLAHTWEGRVYMNPPYGDVIGEWVEKLVTSYEGGGVSAAIALVPARTDTRWFARLRDAAICCVRGRLRFSGADNSAPFPSIVAYLGPDFNHFIDCFEPIGDVWVRAEL